jgi:hypothetical protein
LGVIDLRSCTLWLVDGTVASGGGSVTGNWAASLPFQANTTSTITITGTVAVGNYINFASHMQFYEVIGIPSGSMTIYPALLQNITNGEPVTVLGNGVYARLGEGNLTYSEKRW